MMINVFIILGTFLFLFFGWYGYQRVLDQNPCEMTFSHKATSILPLNQSDWPYQIRKISNYDSQKLNPYPILFIPGHRGSFDHVRSFASQMVNSDHFFQYFSIDFLGEGIGGNAMDAVKKAVFVNEAIKTVLSLYQKGDSNKDQNIILLGYSYGGFLAKTSLLLSNHPQGSVRDIIMLSSPNIKAPLVPDPSLKTLFHSVNKAWYSLHYHNWNCKDIKSNFKHSSIINFQFDCFPSINNTRLISISGGELDILVQPSLTNTFEISARPRNITTLPTTDDRVFLLSKYFQLKSVLNIMVKSTFTTFNSLFSYFKPSPLDDTPETVEVDSSLAMDDVLHLQNTSSPYAYISNKIWHQTIMPYDDPVQFDVRSIQMKSVGFPIDHFATVWCNQYLVNIHQAMKKLQGISDSRSINWEKIFNLDPKIEKAIQNEVEIVKPLNIPELNYFIRRNASYQHWLQGQEQENQFLLNKLNGNVFWLTSVQYLLSSLDKVLFIFNILIFFAIATKGLIRLFGFSLPSYCKTGGLPIHFYMQLFRKVNDTISGSGFMLLSSLVVVISFFLRRTTLSWSLLLQEGFYWLISAALAYGLRVVFWYAFMSFLEFKHLLVTYTFIIPFCWKYYTKFSKAANKFLKKQASALHFILNGLLNWIPEWIFLFNIIVVYYICINKWLQIGITNYWYSLITFTTYITFVEIFLLIILFSPQYFQIENGEKKKSLDIDWLIAFLLSIFGGIPSAFFSWQMLFTPQSTVVGRIAALELFNPDRVNVIVALSCLYLLARNFFLHGEHEIEKVEFLEKFVVQPTIRGPCIHEDGGENCIMGLIDYSESNSNLISLNDGKIIVGSTYQVIWCDCPNNKALKHVHEWCEWCRCPKCGKNAKDSFFGNDWKAKGFGLSFDMLLVLLTFGILTFIISEGHGKGFVVLQSFGLLSSAYFLRTIISAKEISTKHFM